MDCIACAAGKYSRVTGAASRTACLDCSAGKYSTLEGVASELNCLACPAGKHSSWANSMGTNCVMCLAGSSPSPALCRPCHKGSFSPAGSVECTACKINANSTVAMSSRECNAGFARWLVCSMRKRQISESIWCSVWTALPAGTFSSNIEEISEQTCKDCGKDYTSPVGSSSLSSCERKRQQCSVSKTSSVMHIELEANLPYSASTFTIAVQDNFKVGVAAACSVASVCDVGKELL